MGYKKGGEMVTRNLEYENQNEYIWTHFNQSNLLCMNQYYNSRSALSLRPIAHSFLNINHVRI